MQHIGSVNSFAWAEQSNSRQYHSPEQNARVQQVATDRLSVDRKINVPTRAIFFPVEHDLEKPIVSRIELMLHKAVLLRNAIMNNDIQEIFALIKSGANVRTRIEYGRTALHIAVRFNVLMAIIILFQNGADFNAKDSQGYTPLHIAAAFGNTDAVKMLIQLGADRNIKDNQGCTPLDIRRKKDHINIINIPLISSNFLNQSAVRPIQNSFNLKRRQIQKIEPLNRSARIELPKTQRQKSVRNRLLQRK
ncbi:MAG: hypothetical protein ChlgKO_11720 [Chlamydiales bacterium]